jgi:translocation and assembly module TamB
VTAIISRKKRWFRALGLGCLVIVLIGLALPLWFPWVLRPVLARFGIHFDSYQRVGYARFTLTNVRGQFLNARIFSDRITGDLPPRWVLRRYSRDFGKEPFLTIAHWTLRIEGAGELAKTRPTRSPNSTFAIAETISGALPTWRAWLPAARLLDGKVQVGSNEVVVAAVEFSRGKLTATVKSSKPAETFALEGDFSHAPPYALSLDARSSGLMTRALLSRPADRWQAVGELNWQSNRVEWEAGFGLDGWWPKRASAKSDHFRVPAKLLAVGGYDDLTGAFDLDWAEGRFRLEASARATPNGSGPAYSPPLELGLVASGDPDSVVLETLRITSPALQADLSNPIGLNRSGTLTTEAATLSVALDLAQLPALSFVGKLQGQVRVKPMPAGQPIAEFKLIGKELAGRGLSIARADLDGRLRWPDLNLDGAELEFADGSTLGGAGEFNLKSRQVTNGRWHFQGAWADRFLPSGITCSNLLATGQISGPPDAPIHSGELIAEGFSAPRLKPCRLQATWRGETFTFPEATLKLSSGTSTLDFTGAVRMEDSAPSVCNIELKTLTLTRDSESLFRLETPCAIEARREASPTGPNRLETWRLKVDRLHWAGPDRSLALGGELSWPQRGKIELDGHGLSLTDVSDFIDAPGAGPSLRAIDLKAIWDGGPIEFKLSAQGDWPALQGQNFSAELKMTGGANGLAADPVVVSAGGAEILRARGTMPLTLTPENGKLRIRLEEKKAFSVQVATAPNKSFWDYAGDQFGVRITDPQVEAHFEGTLQEVRGSLRAQAAQLGRSTPAGTVKLPDLENVRIKAGLERDLVRLSEFNFEIEKQPVRISGDLPIRQNFLLELISNGALPDWRRARARVEIEDATVEPFTRYLPRALSPQGRLSVGLDVVPGGELKGELRISGAATRPIMPLAPIRNIQATVLFSGRQATISQFTGRIGGREVSLTGRFELPESGEPQFDLRLRGDNVPLVYRPGVLLRSDLNFQLARAAGQPVIVSGDMTLRDGLYLQDLKALVPTVRAEPLGRPPYFSVAEKPFADWRLKVKVHGDRFLRVRTPYFGGEISADFQIVGTLEEPQALGEARINSGLVRFPFGTLNLNQGQASLTSEHPYEPQLFASASSRLYGYNVKMEMTGTASAPFVSFSSTPPLTSEQVLLMLAAGELPRDELSISRGKKAGNFALYLGKDIIARVLGNEDSADRLTIRSGEDVSQEGKSTYYLEYKLTDDLSVVGEYDRFNAMNAGLKWRIFSR